MKKRLLMTLPTITISLAILLILSPIADLTFATDNTKKANAKKADTKKFPKEIIGRDGAKMVLIPAGKFRMGSSDGKSGEKEVHTIYLDAFYMDKYEVTNAQYKKFMDAKGYKAPARLSYWTDTTYNQPNNPVVGISWHDAVAYAKWSGKRLPTEAQWEKAARGGLVDKKYPLGDTITHDDANYSDWDGKNVWNGTSPVGSFAPNGYGLYDMAGNVEEWCADWYDYSYYAISPKQNPTGPSSGYTHVLRGGSWYHTGVIPLRVALRTSLKPTDMDCYVGFRCAMDVPK